MSEFDKLKALLDRPQVAEAALAKRKAEPQEPAALRSPQRRRRRWPLGLLLAITALDAVYLLAKALNAAAH